MAKVCARRQKRGRQEVWTDVSAARLDALVVWMPSPSQKMQAVEAKIARRLGRLHKRQNLPRTTLVRIAVRVEQAWKDTCDATVRNLKAEVAKKRVHKRSYQLFWQALGEGERKRLARMLMEVRAEELRGVERDSFWGLDPDGYPN